MNDKTKGKTCKAVRAGKNIDKMSSKILLRIAAIIMLLHGLVLAFGVIWNYHNSDIYENADFILGASLCGILLALLLGTLLWALSCMTNKSAVKLLWIVATATVLLGIIEIIFFFPYVACIIPGVLAFIALFKLN